MAEAPELGKFLMINGNKEVKLKKPFLSGRWLGVVVGLFLDYSASLVVVCSGEGNIHLLKGPILGG